MGRLLNLMIIFFFVLVTVFVSVPFAIGLGDNEAHKENLQYLQGTVDTSLVRTGFLLVHFDGKLVNGCGDTEILGFVTGPSGIPLQLKPIFLPHEKAKEIASMDGSDLLWPVFDILPLLSDGEYHLEVYVKKECGLSNTAVKIKDILFNIGESI